VPLVEKVLHVQSAGGIGVIIDAGECVAFNQMCSAVRIINTDTISDVSPLSSESYFSHVSIYLSIYL